VSAGEMRFCVSTGAWEMCISWCEKYVLWLCVTSLQMDELGSRIIGYVEVISYVDCWRSVHVSYVCLLVCVSLTRCMNDQVVFLWYGGVGSVPRCFLAESRGVSTGPRYEEMVCPH